MFCPGCGIEEVHSNQFCRACGSDLRRVRTALASSDAVTASAASAREEIGRAIAAKIRDTNSSDELAKVSHRVLPEIEKFLESPEEKRLRRMRTGIILSSIGFGAALGISIVSQFMNDRDVILLAGLGVVTFFIGLGFILNGVFLTIPRRSIEDRSSEGDHQRALDRGLTMPGTARVLTPGEPADVFASVTDVTTQHLHEKHPRRAREG